MEKLAKITPIKKINGTAVLPSSRGSWRVPFGTGQRVNRFMDKSQDEYKLYSPDSFMILKQWISLFFSNELLTAQIYLEKANLINKSLFNFLVKNNFENSWQKIVNNSSSNIQIQKQKHLWFDGFKTLKLIHFLRDIEHPTINMFDALDILLKKMKIDFGHKNIRDQIPSIEVQKDYLEILREIA
jgi:hypothetical protein